MDIRQLIGDFAANTKFSDVHIHANKPLALRVQGNIETFGSAIPLASIDAFLQEHLDAKQLNDLATHRDVDLALNIASSRYRLNVFHAMNQPALSLRKIESSIPKMHELNLPPAVQDMLDANSGLILVTGSTGSGKSTSLSAMIDYLNETRDGHILTIEDPVEYIHENKKCIVSQREVGRDAASFRSALRAALREDPDIILIGEMRDQETIELALTAAETGHLVFGTLHTGSAPDCINRIIDAMPEGKESQIRGQLSQTLLMVMTQRLFRRQDGEGRVAAFELMVCNSAVRNLIRESKTHQIHSVMQTGSSSGMICMDKSIENLRASGCIL